MTPLAGKFDPEKILIVLHGSIGDVTRALPIASLLRQGFPKAHLAWSVEPVCLPLLQGSPAIDEIIVFDRRCPWRSILPFLAKVRGGRFDLVLDLQRILKSGLISRYSGAPRRLGFHRSDSKEFNWLFNNFHIGAFGEGISKLDHFLKFADFLGIERAPLQWRFNLSADEMKAVAARLSRVSSSFAVLFVGTRWESKQWFPAQMARCAEILSDRYQLDTVLLGSEKDRGIAKQASVQSASAVVDLVGHTSLREAIGIIEKAKVAVGPDTGLMHIAAAVGTPVVSLWGATSPERTGPRGFAQLTIQGKASCVPCHRKRCSIGRICMQSIGEAQITAKIDLALTQGRAGELYQVDAV